MPPDPQDASKRYVGGFIPISQEMLDDAVIKPWSFGFRRFTHPWEFPDPNPMPRFTPCPRVARLMGRIEGARLRCQDIAFVARHGLPLHDED